MYGQQNVEFILDHVEFKATEDHLEGDKKGNKPLSVSCGRNPSQITYV